MMNIGYPEASKGKKGGYEYCIVINTLLNILRKVLNNISLNDAIFYKIGKYVIYFLSITL